MRTRCPHCTTLYDIDDAALSRALGMARCFRCGSVFNAFDNPGEEDPPIQPVALDQPVEPDQPMQPDLLDETFLDSDWALSEEPDSLDKSTQELAEFPSTEADIGPEDDEEILTAGEEEAEQLAEEESDNLDEPMQDLGEFPSTREETEPEDEEEILTADEEEAEQLAEEESDNLDDSTQDLGEFPSTREETEPEDEEEILTADEEEAEQLAEEESDNLDDSTQDLGEFPSTREETEPEYDEESLPVDEEETEQLTEDESDNLDDSTQDLGEFPSIEMEAEPEDDEESLSADEEEAEYAAEEDTESLEIETDGKTPAPFAITIDIPENLPEIEPSDEAYPFAPETVPPRRSGWFVSLLVHLLALTAITQILWIKRDQVLEHPIGYQAASLLCEQLDCQLPVKHAPEKFQVLQREMAPIADRPGGLKLVLIFANGAEFAQPLPDLQLTFFDRNEIIMGRRRFTPDEYLAALPPPGTLVTPRQEISVQLLLEDPGPDATGFRLDFF